MGKISRYAINLANQLERIGALIPVGCTDAQVEVVTTALRDVYDNYNALWIEAGLAGTPTISSYAFVRDELSPEAIAVCFSDAEEAMESVSEIEALLKAQGLLAEGEVVVGGPVGHSWQTWDDGVNRLTSREPFTKQVMTVSEFFSGTVLYVKGTEISRFDLVEYAAYHLGFTHAKTNRYQKKSTAKIKLLDEFQRSAPIFRRPNVNYVLLSIGRDLVLSSDTLRFLRTVGTR